MLLAVKQLKITQWAGIRLKSVEEEIGKGTGAFLTFVEYSSRINALPTRLLLERLLVAPINEVLKKISISDPLDI